MFRGLEQSGEVLHYGVLGAGAVDPEALSEAFQGAHGVVLGGLVMRLVTTEAGNLWSPLQDWM